MSAASDQNTLLLGDCHTHLDKYAPAEMPEILERAREAGVGCIISAGTTLDSTRDCIAMAEQYGMMFAGVGIHPMEASEPVSDDVYQTLETLAKSSPKVVCISEVGLDFLARFSQPRSPIPGVPPAYPVGQEPEATHHIPLQGVSSRGFQDPAGRAGR